MRFCCTKLFNWRPEMFNNFFLCITKCGREPHYNDKNLSVKMIYLKWMIWRNFQKILIFFFFKRFFDKFVMDFLTVGFE